MTNIHRTQNSWRTPRWTLEYGWSVLERSVLWTYPDFGTKDSIRNLQSVGYISKSIVLNYSSVLAKMPVQCLDPSWNHVKRIDKIVYLLCIYILTTLNHDKEHLAHEIWGFPLSDYKNYDTMSFSFIDGYEHFRRMYRSYLQDHCVALKLDAAHFSKTTAPISHMWHHIPAEVIFIRNATRTYNLSK
jgi:hypothetical protein